MLLGAASTVVAQSATATQSGELKRYVARNFSEARTFNLYWETNPSHNYTLKRDGEKFEKGRMRKEHTLKFAATLPILMKKKFSVFANLQANFYTFETSRNEDKAPSIMFSDKDNYNYLKATINGNYRTKLFNKMLMLSAAFSGDGWSDGFEQFQTTLSAVLLLKQSSKTSMSVGLFGMLIYDKIPVFPVFTYSHQFNPNLSVDIVLPSRLYLRYQFHNNHRFSVGTSLDGESFYLKPNVEGLPKTVVYSKTSIKPEFVYEYIINKKLYLIARGGVSQIIRAKFLKTNRKELKGNNDIKLTQPLTPFIHVGFSYNLFK